MSRLLRYTIASSEAGRRLDHVVADLLALGRGRTRRLFEEGCVHVDNARARKGSIALVGQLVIIRQPEPERAFPQPELDLQVVLERQHYLIVDKAAGQPSVALRGSDRGTLANALAGHFEDLVTCGRSALESGLLHRLDTWTSGLIAAARSRESFTEMSSALHASKWTKHYLAIVSNEPAKQAGTLHGWLEPSGRSSPRVRVHQERGARHGRVEATCHWKKLRRRGDLCLLEVESSKAYRHQVRALLAAFGCPLVGDTLYGGLEGRLTPPRHALHASLLSWAGSENLPGFCVELGLPPDLLKLLETA